MNADTSKTWYLISGKLRQHKWESETNIDIYDCSSSYAQLDEISLLEK